MHSDYDSAERVSDSDQEDGELRKMQVSLLFFAKSRRLNPLESQSHRGNVLHCYRREEQVHDVLKLILEKA